MTQTKRKKRVVLGDGVFGGQEYFGQGYDNVWLMEKIDEGIYETVYLKGKQLEGKKVRLIAEIL